MNVNVFVMRLTSFIPFYSLPFLALLLFFFLFFLFLLFLLLLLLLFFFFFYLTFPYSQFAFKCRRAGTISMYLYYVTPVCCVGGEYGESRSFSVLISYDTHDSCYMPLTIRTFYGLLENPRVSCLFSVVKDFLSVCDTLLLQSVFLENGNLRAHYTKTTVRAGEVLRLTAVFQDTRRAPVSNSGISGVITGIPDGKSSRSSERDQYAQCLDSHGHELFAPLSARGEFYATCQSGTLDTGSDAVLYRVHQLARRDLPLRVRLVAGPLPIPLPRDYSGLMQLEGATRGPIVLGCAVPLMPERPLPNSTVPELLELVATGPTAPRVKRARLGCPSEARLLASPKMQRLLSACRRALDQRATEPRVAPPKPCINGGQLKELHLKEIKSKPEPKPILQSLKESLEHIKRSTIRDRSNGRNLSTGNNHSFLDKISRIAQGGRSRNPAKKSASFTFAVRPEIGMRSPERYASLESETNLMHASPSSRHQVQRSISTSVLEIQSQAEADPPYSKVRDSLTPLPPTPPPRTEDIYAEICEPPNRKILRDSPEEKPPPPPPSKNQQCSGGGGGGTREKDRGYVKLALTRSEVSDVSTSTTTGDEEGIYNTVC
ncbi:uncharacterized protein LOC124957800 isoform X2 [Vespa velutina]|uniref:uncharacterized protein LOC124957800 isoform X2 n=1 Tax=Vespa velutina TaxID=202808 RepID=UPI001FB4DBA2|nr:uncharacterized protein LOC124957800 isoform X2 [Vespa velutina]